MKKRKKGVKSKMVFVTFMGLALIAAGIQVGRVIKEKFVNKKEDNHEDCCG